MQIYEVDGWGIMANMELIAASEDTTNDKKWNVVCRDVGRMQQ